MSASLSIARIAVAIVTVGTVPSSLTSIDIVPLVNCTTSVCGRMVTEITAVASASPSDIWMVAVQSPKIKVLACSTSPAIRASTTCASAPSAIVVLLPKTIDGDSVNSNDSLVLLPLTDKVSSSPSGSVIPVAKVFVIGPATSSNKSVGAEAPMTGGLLAAASTTMRATPILTGVIPSVTCTVAVHSPDLPAANTPPRRITGVDSVNSAVSISCSSPEKKKEAVGVEANKPGVSLRSLI